MRVFVTGASGHIGSALVPELLAAGHEVLGLARSDESARVIARAGAGVVRGDIADPEGLRRTAAQSDGVVHLAYRHDFTDFVEAARLDLEAVNAMGEGLEGSGKPFVITTGTLMAAMIAPGRLGTEDIVGDGGPRIDSENAAVALGDRGVRSSVVRLAPVVHSSLDHHGFLPRLIDIAKERGVSAYVGDGTNRWPAFHTLDAATLYRLALEKAPAGSRLHGVGDEGIEFRQIASVIGTHLDVPTEPLDPSSAGEHFGFLGALVSIDNPTSNAKTREILGWEPTHPGLIEDMDEGHYFESAR